MREIMNNLTPNDRAKKWLRKHSQSKTNVARENTLFNVLVGKQKLPALTRHFRSNLDDREKNIGRSELRKDILEFLVNNHFLANRIGMFEERTRGRPLKFLEIETRGRKDSYYDPSIMKEIIKEVLSDSEVIREIDDTLLSSPILYEFIRYLWETALYEAKSNELAFRNSYKPAIKRYGIRLAEKGNKSYTLVKDLSEDKLKALARAHAGRTIRRFKEYDKSIVYTISGLIHLING